MELVALGIMILFGMALLSERETCPSCKGHPRGGFHRNSVCGICHGTGKKPQKIK